MKKCRVVLWVVVLALVGLTAAVSAQETKFQSENC